MIVLRPRLYRRLIVESHRGGRLRIVGTHGARVEQFLVDRAWNVSLGGFTVGPIGGDARIELRESRRILLHDLVVSARGTRFSAFVHVPSSRRVIIRRSNFSHCGDRSPMFTNCVLLWRWSHRVTIEDNWFHDCRGCDFIHGRFGTRLTIRRNRFERALPCALNPYRCGHQDLVQLFAGRRLLVEDNRFGVYRSGGAQLYLTNNLDYATIVNNLFLASDPRVPGYRVRMGIVVGSKASSRLPHHARIVNNTILAGARRRDGYRGSIRVSSKYGAVVRWKRPIIVNNVIALLAERGHVCSAAQRFADNIVITGTGCSRSDRVGPAGLNGNGRPRPRSIVIGNADPHYAPRTDANGQRRPAAPSIGAYEYRRHSNQR
jgi:hypothetical protein